MYKTIIFIFFFFYAHHFFANDILNKGLLCKLDDISNTKSLYEAYLFNDMSFISFYFERNNETIVIKETKPENYKKVDNFVIIRGIKINLNTLEYNVMGGTYKCKLLSKPKFYKELKVIKKNLLTTNFT